MDSQSGGVINAQGQPFQLGVLREKTSKSNTKQDLKPFFGKQKNTQTKASKSKYAKYRLFGSLGCVEMS